jgi:hypothetical protein
MSDAAPTTATPSTARPHLRRILRRVLISLLAAVVVPAALLWVTLVTFNFPTAVAVALAWVVGATAWRWATNRPVSGLLVLTLVLLVVRTVLTVATGSAFIYFVQPVFADLVVAAVFLCSLWSARPVVARLAPDFFPMDAAIARRPGVRSLFRKLTLMWGLVLLVKAGITMTLLESLSTATFVLVRGGALTILSATAAVVTIVWSVVVGRREGLLQTI